VVHLRATPSPDKGTTMATTNHLFRREATYYWRCRLPRSIGQILGRSHFARSLRTKDSDQARRLARRLSVVVEDVAQQLRGMAMKGLKSPTREDLDRILLDLFTEVLETGEVIRAARHPGDSPWTIDGDASPEEQELQADQTDPDIGWNWRTHLKHNILDPIIPAVEQMLAERKLRPLDDGAEWTLFLRKAMASVGAALDIESDREQGIYRAPIHPFVTVNGGPAIGAGGIGEEFARQRVSEMFEANIATKKTEGKWKPDSGTEKQARIALRLFIAFKGDLPFAQVQKADAWAFREWLCGLPALVGKSIYANKDYFEAIALREAIAAGLEKLPKVSGSVTDKKVKIADLEMTRAEAEARADRMGKKTINKHLTFFSDAFGQRIIRSGYPLANPFTGILFPKTEVAEEAATREIWEGADLQRLFNLAVWTGSVNAHNRFRGQEKGYLADDGKFWIPLIALFTGMRENEIAMLDTAHIVRDETTSSWIFLVAQVRRSGKTKAAQRKIPVHPILEQIGLIAYRDAVVASGSPHLFPELRATKKKPGQAIGKWFSEYCRKAGLYQRWRDFHALRHTFKTRLVRQLKAHPIMVNEVMGHKQVDEMDIIYFHGFEPAETVPTIRALSYDKLDLRHLFRSAQPDRQFYAKTEWIDETPDAEAKPPAPTRPKRPPTPCTTTPGRKRTLIPGKLQG
jgi:integrase